MSACPGAAGSNASVAAELRLARDVAHMAAQDVKTVVTLLDTVELKRLGAINLPPGVGVSVSNLTHFDSMFCSNSMRPTAPISSRLAKVKAKPCASARPVRPIR